MLEQENVVSLAADFMLGYLIQDPSVKRRLPFISIGGGRQRRGGSILKALEIYKKFEIYKTTLDFFSSFLHSRC